LEAAMASAALRLCSAIEGYAGQYRIFKPQTNTAVVSQSYQELE
jgi:hypothetical protein